MSPSKKKRRISARGTLHADVIAAFSSPDASPRRSPFSNSAHFSGSTASPSKRLADICDRLSCVSTEGGPESIAVLKRELNERVYSPSEVKHVLSAYGSADNAPCLCVMASLLKSSTLRLSDLPEHIVVQRAALEMQEENQCMCRGVHAGIVSLLHSLLFAGGGDSASFLGMFGGEVFQDVAAMSSAENVVARYKLAEVTVRFLRERAGAEENMRDRFAEWLRQCMIPSGSAEHSTSCDVPWTPELSGLATGRPPGQYLANRTAEEKALTSLCAAVSPSKAVQIFAECIKVLVSSERRVTAWQRITGTWSRVAILLRRITDNERFADVDGSHHLRVISTITTAFLSAQAIGDSHTTAVLMCLARRCFFPSGESAAADKALASRHANHEKWLKDLITSNDGVVVKGLVKVLEDLVPLEPLRFLRTNHRIFSANKQNVHVWKDYLVNVRTRISELDPLHNHNSLRSSEKDAKEAETFKKAREDVTNFVLEFDRTEGKLAASLVRQMNFHRYHFRAATLSVLLSPDLEPFRNGAVDTTVERDIFDENRMKLIKVMAFKRKDQAVTAAEAQEAIKAITAVKQSRAAERAKQKNARPESSSKDSEHIDGDSIAIMTQKLLRRSLKNPLEFPTVNDANEMRFGSSTSIALVARIAAIAKNDQDHAGVTHVATEFLQGILNGITNSGFAAAFPREPTSTDDVLAKCEDWWSKDGTVLRDFCTQFIGHDDLKTLRKHIQYQLFALVCCRSGELTPEFGSALAAIVSVLCVLTNCHGLFDLCFIIQSQSPQKLDFLPSVIMSCLPLAKPTEVRASSNFVVHCFRLLKSVPKEWSLYPPGLSVFDNSTQDDDGPIADWSRYRSLLMSQMTGLLCWVLTSPWRLVAPGGDAHGIPEDSKASSEAKDLLKEISLTLAREGSHRRRSWNLKEWIQFEGRCKWGRAKEAQKMFRTFQKRGMSASDIVGETCLLLAAFPGPSYHRMTWIAEGLLQFADEEFIGEMISSPADGGKSLANYVYACVEEHGTTSAFYMLSLLCGINGRYFGACLFQEADKHLVEVLIPRFWPFSTRWLQYLLVSLDKTRYSSEVDVCKARSSFFLISNIVLKWKTLDRFTSDLSTQLSLLSPLVQKADEIHKVVRQVMAFPELRQNHVSQTPINGKTSVAPEDAELLGCSMVLKIASVGSTSTDARSNVGALSNAMIHLLPVEGEATAGAIDAAVYAATLLPFTSKFCEEHDSASVLHITDHIIEVLTAERFRLIDYTWPTWLRLKQMDELRDLDDSRRLFCLWLGRHVTEQQPDTYLTSSLAVAVCMSRVFQGLLSLSENALAGVVSKMDNDSTSSTLLYNILTAYKALTSDSNDFPAEKLCQTAIEHLFTYRERAVHRLLDVVARLAPHLRACPMRNWNIFLDKLLLEFPDQTDEIRAFLAARSLIEL